MRDRRLDELEALPPSWAWDGYLLRGRPNLIVARRGGHKGHLAAWLIAQATRGEWGSPLRVYVDTREEKPEYDYRPQVEAAGGNLELVRTREPEEEPWTFPDDLEKFRTYLEEQRNRGRPHRVC